MYNTPLQNLLFLGNMYYPGRFAVEGTIGVIAILFAIAIRRRKWAFTWPGFAMLGVGLLLDLGVRQVRQAPDLARTIGAISLTLFLWGVIHLFFKLLELIARRGQQHFSTIFRDIIIAILYVVVLLFALELDFHVNPTSLFFTTGVIGAILAFALQETLGNIFSGVTLQLQRPFAPGDWISSDQHVGQVKGMGWRSTTVVTRANERLEIPNAVIAKQTLINYGNNYVADEITLGLPYDQPPNRVREVILRVLIDLPGVLDQPDPEIYAWEYSDFAIKYRVKYWLADYEPRERVRDQVVTSLWYALRRNRIEIPYPVRTVELRQPSDGAGAEVAFEREVISELREFDFLRGLSDEELRLLVPSANTHEFGAGEILVRQGDPGDTLYLIRSGTVEVTARTEQGRIARLAEMSRQEFFGEAAMMTGEPRNATIRARTDVEVLEMSRESFARLFKEHPEAAQRVADVIAARRDSRLDALARASGADGQRERRNWLLAKMRVIFDF